MDFLSQQYIQESEEVSPCEEILENIRRSLLLCTENEKKYYAKSTIILPYCENIAEYKKSLQSTKTQIVWNQAVILKNMNYSVKYSAAKKTLFIES
jgi:hypothetical protein